MGLLSDYTRYNDEELVRLIARSQEGALAQLYERYHRVIFGLALVIIDDHASAEEITLDVFVRVWQKADTYRADQARVSTWLTHIARNHAIDVLRHRNVRLDHRALNLEELNSNLRASQEDQQESVEVSLRRKHIQAALAQLPAEQRQALLLAYFGGYTQRQIAEILSQPLGTIKTRLRLAIQKLRDLLRDEQDFQDTSTEFLSTYNLNED